MLKARCYRLAPLLSGGNHILVIFAQNICIRNCFFGLKMQNSPCPGRGTPPLGRFAHSQFSSQITFGGFRRHGIIFFSYMSKISIWYFLIHDELLENCYEKIVIKVFRIRLILHYTEHLESQSFQGPYKRALDPGRNSGYMLQPQRRRSWGAGGGGSRPPMKILGGNISFPPPPSPQ